MKAHIGAPTESSQLDYSGPDLPGRRRQGDRTHDPDPVFSRLCERYKIEATFHDLRHTYATNLAVAGVHPARTQYLMGHSKAQMTLDCYTHIRGGDMADIAQIVEKTMVVKPVVK